MFFFLFTLVILVSLYDLKYRRIPNWITLPLMLLGLYVGFPGNPIIWIASSFIFSAWKFGFMGGGDAKLWIGLLWCLSSFGDGMVILMFVALMLTGVAQMLVFENAVSFVQKLHPLFATAAVRMMLRSLPFVLPLDLDLRSILFDA